MNYNRYIGEAYLTRRETEFLGLPVGNPFGGAAYGKKEMPFVGLFAAVGTAFAAVGTAAAGAATLAAVGSAVVATVTAVGAVAAVAGIGMSVVGMATGNKSLTKLGMTVGLAGGLAFVGGSAIASMGIAGGEFALGTTALEAANGSIAAGQATAIAAGEVAAGTLGASADGGAMAASMGQSATAAGINPVTGLAATTSQVGGAGFAGVGGSLVPQSTVSASGLANISNTSLLGGSGVTGNSLNALANGSQLVAPTSISSQLGGTIIGGAGSGSSSYFGNMLSGLSASDKMFGIGLVSSVVKGIGTSDSDQLARDTYNSNLEERNRRIKNANSIPTMTLRGSDPYAPVFSSTAPATPSQAAATQKGAGMLAQ